MEAERCPFHDIPPQYETIVYREELSKHYTLGGKDKTLTLPRLADHRWFCPECRSGFAGKGRAPAKLGAGYSSRESKEKALANWNEGVARLIPAIIRSAAKGREA